MLSKSLCTAICALTMTACASSPPTSPPVPLAANLRQPCPPLPSLDQPDGKSVLLWIRKAVGLYNECADRHDRTVEAWPP